MSYLYSLYVRIVLIRPVFWKTKIPAGKYGFLGQFSGVEAVKGCNGRRNSWFVILRKNSGY